MHEFLQALGSFGVAPFTVLLVTAILYWLMVIVGALDIDLVHLGHHGEGAGGGHGDGHVVSNADSQADSHAGPDHHPGLLSGFLEFLSVGKVPLTVIVSLLVFIGWSIAMALSLLLPWAWPVVFVGGLAGAIPLTAATTRPLRRIFGALDRGVATGLSLLGREARITSVECTTTFGTATCDVGDAEVLLRVVSSRPELLFHRDDVVVIADHDVENDRYVVGPASYRDSPPSPVLAANPTLSSSTSSTTSSSTSPPSPAQPTQIPQ